MITSLCKILQYNIQKEMANIKTEEDKEVSYDQNKIEHIFVMCAVWAFGSSLTEKDGKDYRKNFSNWWRN